MFDLYFAGHGSATVAEYKYEQQVNQLYSQLNERKEIEKWVDYKKAHPDHKGKLFVDSGAYSAYTKGKVIDIDDYINFINKIGAYVDVFAEVDKIPQVKIGEPPTPASIDAASTLSWKNYLYMIERIDKQHRDKLIPVFHLDEDTRWLTNMLEYRHPDGSKIAYIGLAPRTEGGSLGRSQWLGMCNSIIQKSSNPDVKTHAFGLTDLDVIEKVPMTSADSTKWVLLSAYGQLVKRKGSIFVSERQMKHPYHILNQSEAFQQAVRENLTRYGLTLEDVASSLDARQKYNIRFMQEWSECLKSPNHIPHSVALF